MPHSCQQAVVVAGGKRGDAVIPWDQLTDFFATVGQLIENGEGFGIMVALIALAAVIVWSDFVRQTGHPLFRHRG